MFFFVCFNFWNVAKFQSMGNTCVLVLYVFQNYTIYILHPPLPPFHNNHSHYSKCVFNCTQENVLFKWRTQRISIWEQAKTFSFKKNPLRYQHRVIFVLCKIHRYDIFYPVLPFFSRLACLHKKREKNIYNMVSFAYLTEHSVIT